MEQAVRRITRSRRDRVFAGVCGGLAAYLGLDPVLVRVLYVALTLLSWGTGILLYVLAWMIVPLEAEGALVTPIPQDEPSRRSGRRIAGVLLVVIGLLALLSMSFGWFHFFSALRLGGPIVLLVIGIILLLWQKESGSRQEPESRGFGAEEGIPPRAQGSPAATEPRRLARSARGRKIAGVCGGLGEYFNVDPTIVRLIFIAAIFAGGAGILLYLLMWIVVPLRRDVPVSTMGT